MLTLIIFGIVALTFILWARWYWPTQFNVSVTRTLPTSLAHTYAYVRDFSHWPAWSPWQIHDPHCTNSFTSPTAIGGSLQWDSTLIGAGAMTHRQQQENQSLTIDLQFLRPFRSQAQIHFLFHASDAQTEVTWAMNGPAPWFIRPFLSRMNAMISNDFILGLGLLSGQLDPQCTHPRIEFIGRTTRAAQNVIVQPYSGSLLEFPAACRRLFEALMQRAQASQLNINAPALCVCYRADSFKQTIQCDLALPVASGADKTISGGHFFHLRYRGAYHFLPQVWHAASGHLRMKKLKFDKRRAALEVYSTSMAQADTPNDLVTDLYLPIR